METYPSCLPNFILVIFGGVLIRGIFIKNTPPCCRSGENKGGILNNFSGGDPKYLIFFGACGGLTTKVLIFERFRSLLSLCISHFYVFLILQWYRRVMLFVKRNLTQKKQFWTHASNGILQWHTRVMFLVKRKIPSKNLPWSQSKKINSVTTLQW